MCKDTILNIPVSFKIQYYPFVNQGAYLVVFAMELLVICTFNKELEKKKQSIVA